MARIDLKDVSLTFHIRAKRKVTLKEYLTKALFLPSRNPRIPVHALSNITLRAKDGDRIGVVGHNGAGKSTLLKMLAGVYPPTAGVRKVDGRVCSMFDIALGFEHDASGWENIRYRAYLLGETPATLKGKIDEIAAFSELGEFLNVPVRYYSSGMLVRLAFSISTAIEPEVLLIDEVLGAGDMAFQAKARDRMRDMMASARLMVLVTHDMYSLTGLCNRAVWLEQGRVVMQGPPAEVVKAYHANMTGSQPHHVGGGIGEATTEADDAEPSEPAGPPRLASAA